VCARVRRGGHDIPATKVRELYDASRNNPCTLIPSLDELMLHDDSIEADKIPINRLEPTSMGAICRSAAKPLTPPTRAMVPPVRVAATERFSVPVAADFDGQIHAASLCEAEHFLLPLRLRSVVDGLIRPKRARAFELVVTG
jgi:hypothetical protein